MKKIAIFLLVLVGFLRLQDRVFAEVYESNTHATSYLDMNSVPTTVYVAERGMFYPKKGSFLDGVQYVFKYRSSDPSILEILENGYWRAHQSGTVTVTIWQNSLEDPRLLEELTSRNIAINPIAPTVAYSPYEVTVTVLPTGFTPVYRLYNSANKEHLYTSDANEKAILSAKKDWTYEGLSFKGQEEYGGVPIYRLYNHGLGFHLYTKDENERKVLQTRGWQDEGVVFYSPQASGQTVYRLYLPGLKKHLFTMDENEKNVLQTYGWVYEGVAWNSQ